MCANSSGNMADTKEPTKEALVGREIPSAVNSAELMAAHLAVTKGMVRTRFPPEPNGYLHVGHAKSMNMNFNLAFEKLGVPMDKRQTFFRFDDTNPEAESKEYVDSLKRDVAWMGWKPNPTTHTSDYFHELYDLAIQLIKRGKAYVCHQSKAEIEVSRDIAKGLANNPDDEALKKLKHKMFSPFRDRSVEENLKEFVNMKKGKYAMGAAALRMKMDMESKNPNMWDQVAYRIKYVAHPCTGDEWCIYPTYDYTHCIIDSLEHIDYSICTLEFETRRESYYWVLEALDLYRPKVFEMSRLNLTNTLLSKRKLLKLVNSGYMRGWSDPRMPTIQGLRRRGFKAEILNAFCNEIGVTRNANVVQYDRLVAQARNYLHEVSPRVMGVLKPLKIQLLNKPTAGVVGKWEKGEYAKVPHLPFDAARGSHFVYAAEDVIYIDSSDFRLEDDKDYFGLAPKKAVGLKYGGRIFCEEVEKDADGNPCLLKCRYLADDDEMKVKTHIQWVGGSRGVQVEVRMYNNLFKTEEPSDEAWEADLNPESEVVLSNAMVDESVFVWNPVNESPFQFERIGFFVVDEDSRLSDSYKCPSKVPSLKAGTSEDVTLDDVSAAATSAKGSKLVFNLTVTLPSSKPKEKESSGPNRSRKEEQMAAAAEKERMKKIPPQEMFKVPPHEGLYKEYDENGVPTVLASGEPVTKSAGKKFKKEWEKQKKLYESANK